MMADRTPQEILLNIKELLNNTLSNHDGSDSHDVVSASEYAIIHEEFHKVSTVDSYTVIHHNVHSIDYK